MAKHEYKDFEIDFDKIDSQIICTALDIMWGGDYKHEDHYVNWNYLGNYIMFADGDNATYYFTKKYLRIIGWDLLNNNEIERCFKYLKSKCE